jgi:site-specific DNA-adenine methylase
MFSYYGRKTKLVHLYPPPQHSLIIEPFAGAAAYSLHYWENDVVLIDQYEIVIKIWRWLQQCSENDILCLPILRRGEDIRELMLSDDEKLFLSFYAAAGGKRPTWTVSEYAAQQFSEYGLRRYRRIAQSLQKIRHWTIRHGCYTSEPNRVATWFIDPPYQTAGEYYPHGSRNIDYAKLADWTLTRRGQVIACENQDANWLPFSRLKRFRGTVKFNEECVWSNQSHPVQLHLFGGSA